MTNQTLVSTCATTACAYNNGGCTALGRHHRRHRRQADLRHFRQARRPRRPSGRQWPRRRVPAPGVRAQQGSAVHRAGHRCRRRHGRVRLVHRSLTGAPPGRRAVGRHPAKRGPRFGAHVVDSGASPHLRRSSSIRPGPEARCRARSLTLRRRTARTVRGPVARRTPRAVRRGRTPWWRRRG